jgi:SAM-dependent methyltransferase
MLAGLLSRSILILGNFRFLWFMVKQIIKLVITTLPRPWLIRFSKIFMRFAAYFYHGDKVECPVCGCHFSRFMPYGHHQVRDNVLCPKCLSLERHRLMWLYLKERTGFFTDHLNVLHIAPEQCFYKRFRKMVNLKYTTADLESPLADVKLDIQNMPFSNHEFDVIICNHVLEHVPDEKKALDEIYRVLKKGGFALLLSPISFGMEHTLEDESVTCPVERERLFRQKDHYRLYGRDFIQRITKAGFCIQEDNYLTGLDMEKRERYRLPEMEYMYGYYKM